jgi:hypothetical protein
MGNSQLEILSGWKEIANHLGKGVRTVQRYERELGLPIRRPAGKSRGSVVATAGELDAWVTASPIRTQFRLTHPGINTEMVEQLRRNVREMARLRNETQQVRRAVSESLQLLRTNIRFAIPDTLAPYGFGRRIRADVLTFDSKKRKVH